MLDTVKLKSPPLGEDQAAEIERECLRRSAVHMGTGELVYELTSGSLEGSWDSRVSVRVLRSEWVYVEPEKRVTVDETEHRYKAMWRMTGDGWQRRARKGRDRRVAEVKPGYSVLVLCEPYVVVEGSIHKAMMGHNVYGGPEDWLSAVRWFIFELIDRHQLMLPLPADRWEVRRADWAECYELPDFAAVEEYVWGLNSAQYPRRSVARYGQESIFAPGRTTALKAYHKGLEFAKHDSRRLSCHLPARDLEELQHRANRILRWETSVKAKKLDADHSGKPLVSEISTEYLRKLHYREVRRLVREGEAEVKTVRKQKDVRDRLLQVYDQRKAGLLLGTWHQLVTLGEKETRRHIPPRTYYRHKKQLIEAGVTWVGSDVLVVPKASSLPADFSPTERSPYRLAGEDPAVVAQLAPYRAA